MLRWLSRTDNPRCAGRTAAEWLSLFRSHRHPPYRRKEWSDSLSEAVREIIIGNGKCASRLTEVLLTDASDAARCVAAIQLSDDPYGDAEISLIAALQDESEFVRRTAAISLFEIGSVRALAAVVCGSRHGHSIRTAAAAKLAEMEPGAASEAVPALLVLLNYADINWRSHFAAIDALCVIGDAALPALVGGLHRGQPQMRKYAALALLQIGKTPDLMPLIESELRAAGIWSDHREP